MAKKKDKPKTVLERTYNIPLRKEFQKAPNWRRTKKAVKALRQFVSKHMKSDNIIINKYVNLELWKHGIKNPPHHIKVNVTKDDKGKVIVKLAELTANIKRNMAKEAALAGEADKKETKKAEEEKKEAKKAEEAKVKDKKKTEEAKTKEDQAKEIEKKEIKELKKELPKQQAEKPMSAPKQQVDQRATAPKGQ